MKCTLIFTSQQSKGMKFNSVFEEFCVNVRCSVPYYQNCQSLKCNIDSFLYILDVEKMLIFKLAFFLTFKDISVSKLFGPTLPIIAQVLRGKTSYHDVFLLYQSQNSINFER